MEIINQALEHSKWNKIETYKPHKKQAIFHSLGKDVDERLFLAGNRTGKTWAGCMEVTYHLTGLYPKWWTGRRFSEAVTAWSASDTTEATRNILQITYLGGLKEEEFGSGTIPRSCLVKKDNGLYKITKRQGIADAIDTVYVKHISGGISKLQFKSYDQGRKKFQGSKLQVAHLDEEPDWDIYEETRIRLTGTDGERGGTMLLTMTPLSGTTDTVLNFTLDREPEIPYKGRAYVQASWRDANHLSDKEIAVLEQSIPAHMLEARSKGIPSIGEGKVYPVAESSIVVPRFEIPEHFERVYGIDFGWKDPTAAIFGAIDPDTRIMYLYAEYKQAELTPISHAHNLYDMGADWITGVGDPFGGVQRGQADGVKMIDRFNEAGLTIELADRNSKMSGIATTLELMLGGKLKVFDDLNMWLSEFRMYGYDKNGKPQDKNDHLMDATRYLTTNGWDYARPKRAKRFLTKLNERVSAWVI